MMQSLKYACILSVFIGCVPCFSWWDSDWFPSLLGGVLFVGVVVSVAGLGMPRPQPRMPAMQQGFRFPQNYMPGMPALAFLSQQNMGKWQQNTRPQQNRQYFNNQQQYQQRPRYNPMGNSIRQLSAYLPPPSGDRAIPMSPGFMRALGINPMGHMFNRMGLDAPYGRDRTIGGITIDGSDVSYA